MFRQLFVQIWFLATEVFLFIFFVLEFLVCIFLFVSAFSSVKEYVFSSGLKVMESSTVRASSAVPLFHYVFHSLMCLSLHMYTCDCLSIDPFLFQKNAYLFFLSFFRYLFVCLCFRIFGIS